MWSYIASVASRASLVDWLLLGAALLLLFYVQGTWNYDYFKKRGIPYIRPTMPFFGNWLEIFFGRSPVQDVLEDWYTKGEGKSVVGVFEFQNPVFMVRDPELLKLVTVKEFDSYMNHRTINITLGEPVLQKNLANLKDERWREVRATLSPAFTSSKIKAMFPLVSQCAQQMADHLRATYARSEQGKRNSPMEVDMRDLFSRLANDVVASVAFGVHCDSLKEPENQFYKMGKELTTFTRFRGLMFLGYSLCPKLMTILGVRMLSPKAVDFFETLVHETIREREKKDIFRPDMLQLLMQARKGELEAETEDAGEEEKTGSRKSKLDDDDVSAQTITFFFAGFETVSSSLCLAAYALSFNPEVQRRLQEEVDGVMEASGGQPSYEAVQGMKYLDAVINETQRLYPTAAATDRLCGADTTLPATASVPAVRVPKGSLISVPIIGLHHDPLYWADPMTFDPERFSDANRQRVTPFTYLPFGVGPRVCIAQRLALIEMKIVLVHILANFDLHASTKVKYPLQYEKAMNLNVKGGFLCDITPREV